MLAAERRNTNKLLDEVFHSEKIYKLNDDMVCSVAGLTSDANLLTNELRLIGQRYKYSYGENNYINPNQLPSKWVKNKCVSKCLNSSKTNNAIKKILGGDIFDT